jgi:hypothetical protein
MSQTYKQTAKGIGALTMKKQIPVWKKEHEWLKECYCQCLQSSTALLPFEAMSDRNSMGASPLLRMLLPLNWEAHIIA